MRSVFKYTSLVSRILFILAVWAAIFTKILTSVVAATDDEPYDDVNETLGIVTAVSDGCIYVRGDPLTEYALAELIIGMNDTPVYDLLTGSLIDPRDINEGMQVRVAYGAPLFSSTPPLVYADVIWLNYGVDGAAVFKTTVSENIHYGDGYCAFISDDGYYRVTLAPETLITGGDGVYLSPEDIRPGMEMFLWADMVTASFPAQAYPDRAAVILPGLPNVEEEIYDRTME